MATLVLLMLPQGGFGLEGVVVGRGGEPVGDAVVSIPGRSGSTRTGPDGRFSWLPDPVAPFLVLVVLPGGITAAPVLVEVVPPGPEPLRVEVHSLVSESVTVSAGATPHTEAPPASAAGVVGRQELRLRQPESLLAAVEGVPGVGRLGAGRAAVPSLRGLARGRTLLLIDGARVTTERRAGPSASYLDPFFLESVEVSRGLGSVSYGSDAFGGIIHARTRQGTPGTPLRGRLRGSVGAGIPERSLAGELTQGWTQGGVILQGRLREFEDYESPGGMVPVSGARDGGFRLGLDQEWGSGRFLAGWQSDIGRDVGKPAAEGDTTLTRYPQENSQRLILGYDLDPLLGFSRIRVDGFVGGYELVTERDTPASEETPRGVRSSDVSAWDYGLRASGTRPVAGWWLRFGLDLNGRRGLSAKGTSLRLAADGSELSREQETSIEDADRDDVGLHVSADGALSRLLTTSFGGRLDGVRTDNRGGHFGDARTSHVAASGYASLSAGPFSGITATGQVGSGFRDPSLSDRYFRGVTGRGIATGNPDLAPERSLQYEVAVRYAGPVRAAFYLYHYRIEDLVERYREGGDYFFRNRGRARLRGAELELEAELPWRLSVELGFQAAAGETLDDGSSLDDIPAEGLTLALRRSLGERGHFRLRGLFRAADRSPGPTEQETPALAVLDVSAVWRWSEGLETRLILKNLGDEAYPQSADERSVLAPGRSVLLSVVASF